VASTREAGDNAAVDLDTHGNVVGIEVISAAHRWPLEKILNDYRIDPDVAVQLVAYFGLVPDRPAAREPVLPVLVAEPTAPSNGALIAA
jgi:hypothetical protein